MIQQHKSPKAQAFAQRQVLYRGNRRNASEMQGEVITLSNIDDENIKVALAGLFKSAMTHGGDIFVQ